MQRGRSRLRQRERPEVGTGVVALRIDANAARQLVIVAVRNGMMPAWFCGRVCPAPLVRRGGLRKPRGNGGR